VSAVAIELNACVDTGSTVRLYLKGGHEVHGYYQGTDSVGLIRVSDGPDRGMSNMVWVLSADSIEGFVHYPLAKGRAEGAYR